MAIISCSAVARRIGGLKCNMVTSPFRRSLTKRFIGNYSQTVKSDENGVLLTHESHLMKLPSGFTVAAIPSPGHFSSLGLYIDAGTRYETDSNSGCTHFMDRMAFKSTKDLERDELLSLLESKLGSVAAHGSREVMLYQMAFFRHNIQSAFKLLSQVSLYPQLLEEEIKEVANCVRFELEEIEIKHDLICSELLHLVAYKNDKSKKIDGLARRAFMEESHIDSITSKHLRDYINTWYTPDRMVLAGVGVDLNVLGELALAHFGDMKPKSEQVSVLQKKKFNKSTYYGGYDISPLSTLRKSDNPDDLILTHVHLVFEGLSMYDPDTYALAVLSTILGGGGSFSAGGPGKGMYTKLYTDVLNKYFWVENCSSINISYKESGLFGIGMAINPTYNAHNSVIYLLCGLFQTLSQNITDIELIRAKSQLQSNLLSNLEGRLVESEDLGRQILYFGKRLSVSEVIRRINQVTEDDIQRVVERVIFNKKIKSPLEYPELIPFKDSYTRGSGKATLVVRAPFLKDDPLLKAPETIRSSGFSI